MRKITILAVAGAAVLPACAAGSELSREDIQWLDRVTYGPSSATVEEYRRLGRRRFLDEQLHPKDVRLPQPAADQLAALDLSHAKAADLLTTVFKEQQRINALPDETRKQADRKHSMTRATSSPTRPPVARFCGRCIRRPNCRSN